MVRLAKALVIGIGLLVLGEHAGYGVEFADVPRDKRIWYVGDLYRLADLGAISGYPLPGGVNFAPERLVTRAEFLKLCLHVLSRGPGLTVSPAFPRPSQAPFPDVSVSAWYAGHVAFAKQWGITEAARARFDPDVPVTRREAVGFVMRTLDLNGGARGEEPLQAFPDSSDPEVVNARSANIIAGREDGLFHPNSSLKRAEAVALVARALRNLEDVPLPFRFEMTVYPLDNPPLSKDPIECPCPSLGIRLNSPDDSQNLIRVRLHGDPPTGGGTYYALRRSNDQIKVWPNADRSLQAYLDNNDTYGFEFGVAEDVFVENVTFGESVLSLELRRKFDHGIISRKDVAFHSFDHLVVVLGGRNQEPHLYDPTNPSACNGCGIFVTGEDLYQEGYDVWLFDEEDVDFFGRGRIYDLVRQAIEQRGVRRIAIIGYSWGGGATHELAEALANDAEEILGEFEVVYTAYVDAINHWAARSEDRRPPRSQYHLNLFQKKSCRDGSGEPLLCGIAIGAVDGTITVNNYVNDSEWGKELGHFSIDDEPLVSQEIIGNLRKALP